MKLKVSILLAMALCTAVFCALAIPFELPDGRRATTIHPRKIVSTVGKVMPGGWVDILATYHDPHSRQDVTKVLVTNVLVLALYEKKADPSHSREDSMTLAVPDDEAEVVAAADKAGALCVAVLQSDQYAARVSLPPVEDTWRPGEFKRLLEQKKEKSE